MGGLQLILSSFIYGLIYGFSLAVPPGPMNALIASRSLKSFREGVFTGLGALSADFIFMVMTYLAYSLIKSLSLAPFYFLGSIYMFILVYLIYRSDADSANARNDIGRGLIFSYVSALLLGLSNPYQILWWLTAGISFLSLFGSSSIIGLFTAILIWIHVFPYTIRLGYNVNAGKTVLIVKVFSASILFIFASYLLYSGIYSII